MKARNVAASVALPMAWFATVGGAVAQTAPAGAASIATTATVVTPTSPMASMLQGLVGLVIVVGLIYVAAWLLKKVGPRTRASGIVQVVGGASVGPREKVVVVRFGQETLLLGVAPGSVTLLHTSDALDAATTGAAIESGPAKPRFADRLRAARGAR